jgi:hypothetical protein
MKIHEVKTAKKVGNFELRNDNSPNKIKINYDTGELSNKELEEDIPRVYLIVSNKEIKKIGGSASKGGIKATMSFYVNAMQGSPGRPRFVIHRLIEKELKQKKEVELYMITFQKLKLKLLVYLIMKIWKFLVLKKWKISVSKIIIQKKIDIQTGTFKKIMKHIQEI